MSKEIKTLQSKRFVLRASLIGQNLQIDVTFKNGKKVSYSHDKAYEVMKDKLTNMNCWNKYKSYTSSSSLPVVLRDKDLS